MSFFNMFFYEFNFIIRQGTTSHLILLYPIIIMLLIGPAFTSPSLSKINVATYGSSALFERLADESSVKVIPFGDRINAINFVKSKGAVMAILIEPSENGSIIKIYNDQSKQAVSNNILLILDRYIAEESLLSANKLIELQSELSPILISLDEKMQDIEKFNIEIENMETNLVKMQNKLPYFSDNLKSSSLLIDNLILNVSSFSSELSAFSNNLSNMQVSVSQLSSHILDIQTYMDQILLLTNESYNQERERDSQVEKIGEVLTKLDNYDSRLLLIHSNIVSIKNGLGQVNPFYDDLILLERDVLNVRSDINHSRSDLFDSSNKLQSLDFVNYRVQLNATYNNLSITKDGLNTSQSQSVSNIALLNSSIQAAVSNLNTINNTSNSLLINIDSLISFSDEFNNFLQSIKNGSNDLKKEIKDVKALLLELKKPVASFVNKSKNEISPPSIGYSGVFNNSEKITFLFPVIIGIDVLLSSLLLPMIMTIRIREQGIFNRLKMSNASPLSIVIGRFFGNYIVSLLQVFLIAVVGIFIFKVYFSDIYSLLFIVFFAPIVFTSLGMLFSQFVTRTSTAFLLSLLISIPMIFLSGTIIPLEFLNPPMDFIGAITPLKALVDLSENMLFRDLSLVNSYGIILYLSGISIGALLLSVMLFSRFNKNS